MYQTDYVTKIGLLCPTEPIRMLQGSKLTNYSGNFAAGRSRKKGRPLERGGGDESVGVSKCAAQTNGGRTLEPAALRANRCGLCGPIGKAEKCASTGL